MSSTKPITLWSHLQGPNPWKVVIVMEELKIPYELKHLTLAAVKEEPFLSVNPNGRVPAIEDPNTGITLWESNAILEYLLDTYDTEGKLGPKSGHEKHHMRQWLNFQTSGQGPYFGQLFWFKNYHPEDVPSAKERYAQQVVRVFAVLDSVLKDKKYLLGGDDASCADLSFIPWNRSGIASLGDDYNGKFEVEKKYPNFVAWHERLLARPSVKAAYQVQADDIAKAQAAQ